MKKCVQQRKALRRVLKRQEKIRRATKKQKSKKFFPLSRQERANRIFNRIKKSTIDE